MVAENAFVSGIDFSLPRAYYVEATVHVAGGDAFDGLTVEVYDLNGSIVIQRAGLAPDVATPIRPLPAGSYYVGAYAIGFREQLFDHFDCVQYCYPPQPGATVVVASSATPAPAVAFDLQPLATVSGVVTDASTHAGLAGQTVTLISTTDPPYQLGGAQTDFDGTYRVTGVPAGPAWLLVTSNEHRDTAYPDAPCNDFMSGDIEGCDLASAMPIPIGNGATVTGIDVALPMNGSISGTVRTRGTGDFEHRFRSRGCAYCTGRDKPRSQPKRAGRHLHRDRPAAGSVLRARRPDRLLQPRWPGIDCPTRDAECPPTRGSPIAVAMGQWVDEIDFDPVDAFDVWVASSTRSPGRASRESVSICGSPTPTSTACRPRATRAVISCSRPMSNHHAGSAARSRYRPCRGAVDRPVVRRYACPDGPASWGCPLANATPIAVPTASPTPIVVGFTLDRVDAIFANGFD